MESSFLFGGAQSVLAQSKEKAPNEDIAVKAIVRDWKKEGIEDFNFYSKYERETKNAIERERHQVGSTLKPIIYAALTDLGVDLEQSVETGPVQLQLKSGAWTPQESQRVQESTVSVAQALRMSLNRPLIRLAQTVGFDVLEEYFLVDIPTLKRPLGEYPAQLLGSLELSLSELAKLYEQFFFKQCRGNSGAIINILDDPKQTTIKRVVGRVMSQMRFFGKTGTSNGGRDNWFVFYDGAQMSVVWVGQESGRQGEKLNLYGSSTAFKILENYLLYRGRLFNDLHCVNDVDMGN
jgi:penicillin-binding protein 1B